MAIDTPDGWRREPISGLGALLKSRGGTKKDQATSGIPVVRYGELYTHHHEVIRRFVSYVAEERAAAYTILKRGDVLFATSGETVEEIGKAAVYLHETRALGAGDMIIWRPNGDLYPHFLGYAANGPDAVAQKKRLGQGSSVFHLYADQLECLTLLIPPLGEQRKIAAILSAVDDVIDATQAVIDQLQVVKKAMLAQLLTRGAPGRHSDFTETEIGALPNGWKTPLLDQVATRGSGHTPSKTRPEYWEGNIKWVSLTDSPSLDRLYIHETSAKITAAGIANSSAVEYPAGAVILSRDGSRVGKSAITTDVMAVSQHFIAWMCGPDLDNYFLYYWLQYKKPEFARVSTGSTTNRSIGLPYFRAKRIALPPIEEQREISRTLRSFDLRIFGEEDSRATLQTLKSALTSVLLSGEIRVEPSKDAA